MCNVFLTERKWRNYKSGISKSILVPTKPNESFILSDRLAKRFITTLG
jgi:hypothetical protein